MRAVVHHFARFAIKQGVLHIAQEPRKLFFSLLGKRKADPLFANEDEPPADCAVEAFCEQVAKKGLELPRWLRDAYREPWEAALARHARPTKPAAPPHDPAKLAENRRMEQILALASSRGGRTA